MKHYILFAFFPILLFGQSEIMLDPIQKHMVFTKNYIGFSPFSVLVNSKLKFHFEHRFGKKWALKNAFFIGFKDQPNSLRSYVNSFLYGLEFNLKYHLLPNIQWINGLYLFSLNEFKSIKFNYQYNPQSFKTNTFAMGLGIGYHLILWNKISIDWNLNYGYRIQSGYLKYIGDWYDKYAKGNFWKSTFSIGYGF